MAHHKRGKPKNARSGCLFCKYHKGNGFKGRRCDQTRQEKRAMIADKEWRSVYFDEA